MESGNHNSQFSTLNSQLSEFDEIRPYEPEEMKQAFEDLLNDRQFNVLMKGFAPWLPRTAAACLHRRQDTARLPEAVHETHREVYHPQAYRWLYI